MNSNTPPRLRLLPRTMLVLGLAAWGFVAAHLLWFGLTRDLTKVYVLANGTSLPPGAVAGGDDQERPRLLKVMSYNLNYPVIVGGDFNTSYARLANCEPCAKDPTLPTLLRSNLVLKQGFFDEETLDYLLLRPGDPTSYVELYKLPTQTTDHSIIVSEIALSQAGDLVHRRAPVDGLILAMNR